MEAQPDSHLNNLALLPISFLSEQGDQFAAVGDQPVIGDNYRAFITSSVWMYSLHAYRALLREQLGNQVARAVCLRQREIFDAAGAGAGQSMESAFALIDGVLDPGIVGPGEAEAAIQVLPETRVALGLLLGMPGSPDYAGSNAERSDRMLTMRAEVEVYLARCLLQSREALLAACSKLFAR